MLVGHLTVTVIYLLLSSSHIYYLEMGIDMGVNELQRPKIVADRVNTFIKPFVLCVKVQLTYYNITAYSKEQDDQSHGSNPQCSDNITVRHKGG